MMQPSEWVAIGTGLAMLYGALRLTVKQIVRDELAAFTRPIQPGYRNGGESLADVAHELRRLQQHVGLHHD